MDILQFAWREKDGTERLLPARAGIMEGMNRRLLTEEELERSGVVANCNMNLDVDNLKLTSRRWFGGQLGKQFKRSGLEYHRDSHLLWCCGKRVIHFLWSFVGADDAAGPNFTAQSAVDSYYSLPTGS